MTFFNIFSNKEEKLKKEEILKIIIDNREKNSLVPSELIKLGFQVEFKHLSIADYLINDIAIERKTFSDLQSSIINKRIFSQLKNLKQYEQSLVIIEGKQDKDLFLHENAIRGFVLHATLDHNIPVLFTKDEKETALYLKLLANKTKKRENSLRESKSFLSKKERMQYILEGFPNIGPINAKKLITEFRSIKNIMNATEEELEKVLKKKSTDFKALIEDNV